MNEQGCCGDNSDKMDGMQGMMPPMAKKMMEKVKGGGFNPMEMCKNMMTTVESTAKMAGLATPEVQMLFEEWVAEVEQEILNLMQEDKEVDPSYIAEELKISEDSVLYFISKLIRDKKVKITGLEIL